jgi:hypothetical protein
MDLSQNTFTQSLFATILFGFLLIFFVLDSSAKYTTLIVIIFLFILYNLIFTIDVLSYMYQNANNFVTLWSAFSNIFVVVAPFLFIIGLTIFYLVLLFQNQDDIKNNLVSKSFTNLNTMMELLIAAITIALYNMKNIVDATTKKIKKNYSGILWLMGSIMFALVLPINTILTYFKANG